MRRCFVVSLLLIFLHTAQVAALADDRPLALLFPATAGDGAQPTDATETTLALKTYLRQTGKADVIDFDPDSALVRRAILEHHVKPDELVGVTTPEARLQMGSRLGASMVLSGDVSIKDDKVTVSGWLGDIRSKKTWRLDAVSTVSPDGDSKLNISNAIQGAASSVIYELADKALKEIRANPQPQNDTTAIQPPVDPSQTISPADEAGTHLSAGDQFAKAGDAANAILEYRRAVNADPKNLQARLKLARLYVYRKMLAQALDELARAQQMDPQNKSIREEMAAIYEKGGYPEKAAELYVAEANANPTDLDTRLSAGDYYSKKQMFDDAETQYQVAAHIAPTNPAPYERLAMLFAQQSLFNESRKSLEKLQAFDPKPEPNVLKDRYTKLRELVDRDVKDLLAMYDKGAASFGKRDITREYYYELLKGIGVRTESIVRFLDVLTPPEIEITRHRHLVLGCSLLSQALTRASRYLETNQISEKEDAAILLSEARKHLTRGEEVRS